MVLKNPLLIFDQELELENIRGAWDLGNVLI